MQGNATPAGGLLFIERSIKMLCHNMLSNISETLVFFIARNRPHGVKTAAGISLAHREKNRRCMAGETA